MHHPFKVVCHLPVLHAVIARELAQSFEKAQAFLRISDPHLICDLQDVLKHITTCAMEGHYWTTINCTCEDAQRLNNDLTEMGYKVEVGDETSDPKSIKINWYTAL